MSYTELSESQVEAVMQQIPDSIKIPYAQMKLERNPIGQGTVMSLCILLMFNCNQYTQSHKSLDY